MKRKGATERLRALLANYKYVLLMAALGVGLLLFPSFSTEGGQEAAGEETATQEAYSLAQTEAQMETLLSQMDGVGQVSVMLTVSSGSTYVYQDDREVSYSGAASAPEDYRSNTETVLLSRGSGGQEALQTQEIYPAYLGAVVVCDGAGNTGTVLKVKEAVSVLTGLGTDRISVVKRSAGTKN
jgi:stage III sporulation protein AG